jgi:hypothetical protein
MIVVGIDCGKDGAIAVLRDGCCVALHDMPTLKVGKREEYDAGAMTRILVQAVAGADRDLIAIEHVTANPKNGAIGAAKFFTGFGIWIGIIASLGLRLERVTPQRWRKAMLEGLPKGKGSSMLRARELFPALAPQLARKKDDGRAEALLIAEYARRTFAAGGT